MPRPGHSSVIGCLIFDCQSFSGNMTSNFTLLLTTFFLFLFLLPLLRRSSREQTTASCSFSPASWPVCFTCFDFVSFVFSRNIPTFQITLELVRLVSKESLLSATMYRNGNFGLVFGRGEMLLTYMIFVYHWTSLVSRTSRKI